MLVGILTAPRVSSPRLGPREAALLRPAIHGPTLERHPSGRTQEVVGQKRQINLDELGILLGQFTKNGHDVNMEAKSHTAWYTTF